MTVIGVLSTAALYIIGVPGALFLVIFTGLVCFVPLIGPVVSAVPPLVLDFAGNPIDALWVLLAYIAIQQVESNLLIWHSTSSPEDGLTLPPLAASLTLPLFGKRPSASRSAWPTGTSRGPKAGRSSWRPTTGSSRTTTPSPTSPTSAAKTVVVPRGRPELGCGDAIPPKGPRARLLLRAPHADAGRLRLRDPDALETLRRGRPRRQGGGSLAAGEDAHRGARRREPLSAYEIQYDTGSPGGRSGSGKLLPVGKPTLFETSHVSGQMRLFGLAETLGEDGWLKALRLEDYAPSKRRGSGTLQHVLRLHGRYLASIWTPRCGHVRGPATGAAPPPAGSGRRPFRGEPTRPSPSRRCTLCISVTSMAAIADLPAP